MNFYKVEYIWERVRNLFGFTRKQEKPKPREYAVVDTINFTDIFANALKNLTLTDCKIQVTGTSQRAKLHNEAVTRLRRKLGKATSFLLGYGGVIIVPYVVGKDIFYDIVQQDSLEINLMYGDMIVDCAILADRFEKKSTDAVYYRFAHYKLENGVLRIQNIAQKDATQVELTEVEEWAAIPPEVYIAGVEKMPFAYMRCPKDNRKDVQMKGVPITFGADKLIDEIKACLCQYEEEYGAKQTRIFVDDVLFGVDNKLDKVYKKLVMPDGNPIDVYDPAFRDQSYNSRLETLFVLLERSVGTSAGILTPMQSRGATATEIKAAMQDTFSIVSDVRDELERGLQDFVDACEVMANYYSLGARGDYELDVSWSYAMIENSTETFAQLVQGQSIGAVSKAEVRQFVYPHETKEEAQKSVDEIKATEPSVMDNFGENLPEGA